MAFSAKWATGNFEIITVDEYHFHVDKKLIEQVRWVVSPSKPPCLLSSSPLFQPLFLHPADTSPELVAHGDCVALTDPFERALILDKFLTAVVNGTLDTSDISPRLCFEVFDFFNKWCVKTHDRATDPCEKFVDLVADEAKAGNCVYAVPLAFYSLIGDQVSAVHLMNEGGGTGGGWPRRLPKWIAARMPRPWVTVYEEARDAQLHAKDWDRMVKLGDWFDEYHGTLGRKQK